MIKDQPSKKIKTGQKRQKSGIHYLLAGETLKTARNMSDHYLEAIYAMAYGHFSAGHYQDALNAFRYLSLLDHQRYLYLLGFGATLKEVAQYTQAIEVLKYANTRDKTDPRASVCMTCCLIALGREEEAKKALQDARGRGVKNDKWHELHPQVKQMDVLLA
ncbi:tetratricopeptide repeat protein [Candidatus Sororendozoicomonas aggregata]|uniref:tetratricopeptide repeat protein n=1 Tax=Candidatus Sororendozoicomonas aggregata TaxID=3073239 RepID=UPI002ED60A05